MQQYQQHELAEQLNAANDKLLAAQDEIELLREQIKSLNSLLQATEHELQKTQQELKYTNRELCDALRLKRLELDKVKKSAVKVLKKNKSVSKFLTERLAAIYDFQVSPKELEQIDRESIKIKSLKIATDRIITLLEETNSYSKQIWTQLHELKLQSVCFKRHCGDFKQQRAEFIAELTEKNNFIKSRLENDLSYSFPPPQKI